MWQFTENKHAHRKLVTHKMNTCKYVTVDKVHMRVLKLVNLNPSPRNNRTTGVGIYEKMGKI